MTRGVQSSPSSKPASPTAGNVSDKSANNSNRSTHTNNHPLTNPSPTLHRQQKFPHDVVDSSRHITNNHNGKKSASHTESSHPRRAFINLVDSDTEANSTSEKLSTSSAPPSRNRSLLNQQLDTVRGGSTTKSGHRASASPSISSLIDPQPPTQPHTAASSLSEKQFNSSFASDATTGTNGVRVEKLPRSGDAGEQPSRSPKSKNGTAPSSAAASPKPRPSLPSTTGNGLLSGVLPGTTAASSEPCIPNIYIHVPLNGEHNKYVNFAKLAEERYGWAALNPKLAKARENMLKGDSGDEMMVDGSESESNVEMDKPMDSEGGKRKKRRHQDIYDKNDPFIDDTEMLWEEQAAASKDGFFVYSGPLVPEGEKPQIERADGTVKRGRGRGRGGTTRGTAAARGPTIRKPRLTKKEKERMEKEKEEREKTFLQASSAKPPGGG
ncbi:histone promoter control 2 [Choiromyces venosus 120613-1]|uniref:Histone promoter control 2 n=1 Tax=Choiromyces venosus 120613-1 TaxID=1336337 RepID=A0A3N4JDM5_9PEZI|nr:histone promoter control 2 [Choiromyces venosus 120613-1]